MFYYDIKCENSKVCIQFTGDYSIIKSIKSYGALAFKIAFNSRTFMDTITNYLFQLNKYVNRHITQSILDIIIITVYFTKNEK